MKLSPNSTLFYRLYSGVNTYSYDSYPFVSLELVENFNQSYNGSPYYGSSPSITIRYQCHTRKEYDTSSHLHPNHYPLACGVPTGLEWSHWYQSSAVELHSAYNVVENAKMLVKVLERVESVATKYNLYDKYKNDALSLTLESFRILHIARLEQNSSHEWYPIFQPKRKAA